MTEMELITGLKYLGIVYGKEFDKDECKVYYDFLQKYQYDVFRRAVKNLIEKTKFLPKLSEIIEECEACKSGQKFEVLEVMHKQGYFKDPSEYEKATNWLTSGIIPKWFLEDMREYYKIMKQDALETKEALLLE